jgi:galactose mutarotase-like enzyme
MSHSYFLYKDETMELVAGEQRCTIRPDLGGRVTSLIIDGQEWLWMPDNTTPNEHGWIHGGIPFLFPFAGRVWHNQQLGHYCWQNQTYPMTIHGYTHRGAFARTSSEQYKYVHSPEDKQMYPFEFDLSLHYSLNTSSLNIKASVISDQALPMAPGFHPYFLNPNEKKLGVLACPKTQAFQVKAGRRGDETGWPQDPWDKAWQSLIFKTPSSLAIGTQKGEPQLSLEWSSEIFPWVVSWTDHPKHYLCVEPWSGLPDAIHDRTFIPKAPSIIHNYEMTLRW